MKDNNPDTEPAQFKQDKVEARGCCAHINVRYETREPNNYMTGWWQCRMCEMQFVSRSELEQAKERVRVLGVTIDETTYELAQAKEHIRQWERVGDKMDRGIKEIETELQEAKERERRLREALTRLELYVDPTVFRLKAEAALTVPPAKEKIMSDYMQHPDEDVRRAITRLSDALCTWERATGIQSILILRDETDFVYRAMSGKPGIPDDIPDASLVENIASIRRRSIPPAKEKP